MLKLRTSSMWVTFRLLWMHKKLPVNNCCLLTVVPKWNHSWHHSYGVSTAVRALTVDIPLKKPVWASTLIPNQSESSKYAGPQLKIVVGKALLPHHLRAGNSCFLQKQPSGSTITKGNRSSYKHLFVKKTCDIFEKTLTSSQGLPGLPIGNKNILK